MKSRFLGELVTCYERKTMDSNLKTQPQNHELADSENAPWAVTDTISVFIKLLWQIGIISTVKAANMKGKVLWNSLTRTTYPSWMKSPLDMIRKPNPWNSVLRGHIGLRRLRSPMIMQSDAYQIMNRGDLY